MKALALLLALTVCTFAEDISGRWSTGTSDSVFVFRQSGESLTGTIVGKPGEPTYKIVDGYVRGNQVFFFVLHDAPDDPEVRANNGLPFHNTARGTVSGNELTLEGSRENTTIRQYRMTLKRLPK